MKYLKLIFFIIAAILLCQCRSSAGNIFADPKIPDRSVFIYDSLTSAMGRMIKYEVIIKVNDPKPEEDGTYRINVRYLTDEAGENLTEAVYSKEPFSPLNYVSRSITDKVSYSKEIKWDWESHECSYLEKLEEKGKKPFVKEFSKTIVGEGFFDIDLLSCGLLNSISINSGSPEGKAVLAAGSRIFDTDIRLTGIETVEAGGRIWDCYKIEAVPDLGPILNIAKLFMGNLKSEIWITREYPKVVAKVIIRQPWMETRAELKEWYGQDNPKNI
jgi:hypothetical protein